MKIHNGRNFAHAQDSNALNFCLRQNSAKLIRTFIGQFLKGNSMGPIKIHNGGNYAHAQDSDAYNLGPKKFLIVESLEIISQSYYLNNNWLHIVLKSIQKAILAILASC